jgi:hypothetical protein
LNTAAGALNAGGLFGSIGLDNIRFMTAWFTPQDSALQFESLDYAPDDIINCGPAFPEIIP